FQIAGLLNRTESLSLVHLFLNLRHLDTLTDNLVIFRLSDCLPFLTVCGLVVDEDFHAFVIFLLGKLCRGWEFVEMRLQYVYLYADSEEFESALFSALDFTPIAIEILIYATPQMIFCPTKEEHVAIYQYSHLIFATSWGIDFFRCSDSAVGSFLNIELGVNAIVRFVELLGPHSIVYILCTQTKYGRQQCQRRDDSENVEEILET
ncbi:hypothetical protein HID58_008838, partial [Brassica napus]